MSYEFVATQKDKNGVLILSEFAGAAQSMNGAIIVNPWSIEELIEAYHEALSILPQTAARHHEKLFKYVTKHTATYWGQSFVSELERVTQRNDQVQKFVRLSPDNLKDSYRASTQARLIIISMDNFTGAKVKFKLKGINKLMEATSQLATSPKTMVYILSNAERHAMERLFPHGNVGLVSEQGCYLRHPMQLRVQLLNIDKGNSFKDDWVDMTGHSDEAWRERIAPILSFYTDHTPGAVLEERERILVWDFSDCEQEYGQWQASELQANLEKILTAAPVTISLSSSTLELRPSLIDKAVALRRILSDTEKINMKFDFIWSLSYDSSSDERLFSVISGTESLQGAKVFTTSVGKKRSAAQYYLPQLSDALPLLEDLIAK